MRKLLIISFLLLILMATCHSTNNFSLNNQQPNSNTTSELTLITETEQDSSYCTSLMPKIAFDGTQYIEGIVFRSPVAKLKDESLGSIQSRISNYYNGCLEEMGQDNKALIIASIFLIIDEKGILRGLYFDLDKSQKEIAMLLARKIFREFNNEEFLPAIDIETGNPISDIIEVSLVS